VYVDRADTEGEIEREIEVSSQPVDGTLHCQHDEGPVCRPFRRTDPRWTANGVVREPRRPPSRRF